MANEITGAMKPCEALAIASELEKLLQSKGIWYNRISMCEPELKFIKIEVSIKVRK